VFPAVLSNACNTVCVTIFLLQVMRFFVRDLEEPPEAKGVNVAFEGPFFNELVVKLPVSVTEANNHLLASKIIGGYDLSRDNQALENHMLLAFTELRTKEEIDQLVNELGDLHA